MRGVGCGKVVKNPALDKNRFLGLSFVFNGLLCGKNFSLTPVPIRRMVETVPTGTEGNMLYHVRQRQIYFEDFEVEADSPEEAIDLVDSGDVEESLGSGYLETVATYLTNGYAQLDDQPENATLPEY
jgi:hypothetical protein